MAKQQSILSRVKFVYRHSPLVLKCVVLATLVLSVAALTVIRLGITQAQNEKEAYRAQAAILEQQQEDLKEKIDQQDTVEGVQTAAKEELGYVDPDTIFFDINENQD